MSNQFAKGYAEALFDLALEKANIEVINDQFNLLIDLLQENNELIKLLNHPQIDKDEKKQVIKTIFNHFDQVMVNFLFVIIDNNRITDIIDIHNAFIVVYNEYQNIIFVKAYTAVQLDKSQIDRLKIKLMIKYRHKIEIINLIDKSVIGGIKLIINENIIDFTINNQIKNLKSHVLKQI